MKTFTSYIFFAALAMFHFTKTMRTQQHKPRHMYCDYNMDMKEESEHNRNAVSQKKFNHYKQTNLIHNMKRKEYFAWYNEYRKPTLLSYEKRKKILEERIKKTITKKRPYLSKREHEDIKKTAQANNLSIKEATRLYCIHVKMRGSN